MLLGFDQAGVEAAVAADADAHRGDGARQQGLHRALGLGGLILEFHPARSLIHVAPQHAS